MKPNNEYQLWDMLDNGVNPDIMKEDGVYSKYFVKPTEQGRYTFKCQVNSNHNTFERFGFIGSASPQLLGIVNYFHSLIRSICVNIYLCYVIRTSN